MQGFPEGNGFPKRVGVFTCGVYLVQPGSSLDFDWEGIAIRKNTIAACMQQTQTLRSD